MKITVKDNTTENGVVTIKPINLEKLAEDMGLFDKLIEWHYNGTDEYQDVSNIDSEEIVEYTAELLAEKYDDDSSVYEKLAEKLVENLHDKLVDEILSLDKEGNDFYWEKVEAAKGRY